MAHFVKDRLITSSSITTSKCVTLYILWKEGLSYDQQVVSALKHVTGSLVTPLMTYDQQEVSDIEHFVKGSLITYFLVTNRKWVSCTFCGRQSYLSHNLSYSNSEWVTLNILWKAISSHIFLWPTASGWWHCTFYDIQSQVSTHVFLWPPGAWSVWHCPCCERKSHHIFSYDQQQVSSISHFMKGSLTIHHIFS